MSVCVCARFARAASVALRGERHWEKHDLASFETGRRIFVGTIQQQNGVAELLHNLRSPSNLLVTVSEKRELLAGTSRLTTSLQAYGLR